MSLASVRSIAMVESIVSPPAPNGGGADDAADLETWFASVPNGSTVKFSTSNTYILDTECQITDSHGLKIVGMRLERTVADGVENASLLYFRRCNDIEIDDIVITDTLAAPAYVADDTRLSHGIRFGDCSNVKVHNFTIGGTYGDAIYPGNELDAVGHQPNVNFEIYDGTIDITGRQGISPVHIVNCWLHDIDFDHIPRSVIDLEPQNNWQIRDLLIEDLTATNFENNMVANGGGGPTDRVTVRRTHAVGKWNAMGFGQSGDNTVRRSAFVLTDNTSDTICTAPRNIWLRNVEDVTIDGNTQPGQSNRTYIECDDAHNVDITNNDATGFGTLYTEANGCTDITESGNTI